MSRPEIVMVAGPTASGKSALALALAEQAGGTVINADSMQVYGDLRVITARPTPAEEARAPHRLYGHVDAAENYSVGRWCVDVGAALGAAQRAGRLPILVGGTGLYFHTLTTGLAPIPDVPDDVRRHWRARAEDLGPAGLHAALAARDPLTASRLRPSDPQRLVRALEVLDATGIALSEWQGSERKPVVDPTDAIRLVVAPDRAVLYSRIDARFEQMLAEGALDEVASLARRALDPALPIMRALGARPLMSYMAGEISREQATARIQTDSRRYAKRQLTWARHRMTDWTWLSTPEQALDHEETRVG